MSNTFEHTRAALAVFDAGAAERQHAWDAIESNADVERAEAADRAALDFVRVAFHRDTAHINSIGHCRLVDIDFMRRLATQATLAGPTERDIERTVYGKLDSVNLVFSGLHYVRSVVTPQRGSALQKEPGELFVCLEGDSRFPRCWAGRRMDHALVATPLLQLPRFATTGNGPARQAGSLRIIAWPSAASALIIATDPGFISDRWLAFVPLDSVLAIPRPELPATAL